MEENLIQKVIEIGPKLHQNKTDKERIDAVLNHPLFMDSFNVDNEMEKETLEAIQSLVYDGTPEEMAENFKVQGNACYAAGSARYKDALQYYTQGIALKCSDNELNSILHSNRAAVNLAMMNYRSTLYDCGWALKFNSKNIKAYFRSIKALRALDRVDEGIDCCIKASELDEKLFVQDLQKFKLRKLELEQFAETQKLKDAERQQKLKAFEKAKLSRNYNFIEQLDDDGELLSLQHPDAPLNQIKLTSEGDLTLPVIFLYPEFNQSDIISDFNENTTFFTQYEIMFSEPASWDVNGQYTPYTIDLYYATIPKNGDPKLINVIQTCQAMNSPSQSLPNRYVFMTLKDVLSQKDFPIVNGVATFIVLSRDSEYSSKYRMQFNLN